MNKLISTVEAALQMCDSFYVRTSECGYEVITARVGWTANGGSNDASVYIKQCAHNTGFEILTIDQKGVEVSHLFSRSAWDIVKEAVDFLT